MPPRRDRECEARTHQRVASGASIGATRLQLVVPGKCKCSPNPPREQKYSGFALPADRRFALLLVHFLIDLSSLITINARSLSRPHQPKPCRAWHAASTSPAFSSALALSGPRMATLVCMGSVLGHHHCQGEVTFAGNYIICLHHRSRRTP